MIAYYDDVHILHLLSDTPLVDKVLYGINTLEVLSVNGHEGQWVYELSCPELPIGTPIELVIGDVYVHVIPRMIVKTQWFEDTFGVEDARLGSWVEEDKTYFAVWSPTSEDVQLKLDGNTYPMTRNIKGVYTAQFDQNLHGALYAYSVVAHGERLTTTDPYAKASMPNRGGSVVVDFTKLDLEIEDFKPKGPQTLLEVHVRDFSMDPEVPFINRGNFLGLLESHGNYGMKHILDLGVSHIQLMPINDFETVDELNPLRKYNWGYDPMQYMALEGSYSSNVKDAHQIIRDFAKVVDGYHKAGVGVNMDVVFNHVYKQQYHPLNILVPYYYFRYREDMKLSDGSFCGNELASEKVMCRKLIVDTCAYYVDTFKVDGFRFDLMGLTDIETMRQIQVRMPEIMVYGEGWKMPTVLDDGLCATIENQYKLPDVGFFNDVFRNTIGGSLDGEDLGFAGHRGIPVDSIVSAIFGSADPGYRPTVFTHTKQSVNYVECHDNLTVADRVKMNGESWEKALFMIGIILMSQGVAFLQIGQSFFRDKQGDHNSYQSPDDINMIRWKTLDAYQSMNETVQKWIQVRNDMYQVTEGYHARMNDTTLIYVYGNTTWNINIVDKTIGYEINA